MKTVVRLNCSRNFCRAIKSIACTLETQNSCVFPVIDCREKIPTLIQHPMIVIHSFIVHGYLPPMRVDIEFVFLFFFFVFSYLLRSKLFFSLPRTSRPRSTQLLYTVGVCTWVLPTCGAGGSQPFVWQKNKRARERAGERDLWSLNGGGGEYVETVIVGKNRVRRVHFCTYYRVLLLMRDDGNQFLRRFANGWLQFYIHAVTTRAHRKGMNLGINIITRPQVGVRSTERGPKFSGRDFRVYASSTKLHTRLESFMNAIVRCMQTQIYCFNSFLTRIYVYVYTQVHTDVYARRWSLTCLWRRNLHIQLSLPPNEL